MFRDSRLVVAEVFIMVHVSTECNNSPIVVCLMLFLLDQGVRQKRQVSRPQDLRVEYTTANSGIVRWSHPTSGAPNSYELIYAAIIGERERAYLVVQTARFFCYIYIYIRR